MKGVLLAGAGGLAREVLSARRRAGLPDPAGFLDDDAALHGRRVNGLAVLGAPEEAAHRDEDVIVCPGSGAARERLVLRLAAVGVGPERIVGHVDDRAWVGSGCRIGRGSIVLAGAVLTADLQLGEHVVLMPRVTLTHDDAVGDFATLAAGVSLGGGVSVGRRAYLGMNASVRQGVRIGDGALVGMGAVVLRDVPEGRTWAGVPAAELRGAG